VNDNMTRDQLAMAATEEDLKQYFRLDGRPVNRQEARYAFADSMIKARGKTVDNPSVRPISGWIIVKNGAGICCSGIIPTFEEAHHRAVMFSKGDIGSFFSLASVGEGTLV
jgi:hypothetical protein